MNVIGGNKKNASSNKNIMRYCQISISNYNSYINTQVGNCSSSTSVELSNRQETESFVGKQPKEKAVQGGKAHDSLVEAIDDEPLIQGEEESTQDDYQPVYGEPQTVRYHNSLYTSCMIKVNIRSG